MDWQSEADDCVMAFDDPCALPSSHVSDAVLFTRAKMRAVVTWVATVEFRRVAVGADFPILRLVDLLTAMFFRLYRIPMCAAGAERGLQVLSADDVIGEMIARMRALLDVVHTPRCNEAVELATDGDWQAWWWQLGEEATVDEGRRR